MYSSYFFLRLYGAWLVGFSPIPCCDACVLTAAGVRPSFNPITRVGVLPFANVSSEETSAGVHGLPEFRLYFAMSKFPFFT
jgi:hypothetical protein